jgi:hypothetical protein
VVETKYRDSGDGLFVSSTVLNGTLEMLREGMSSGIYVLFAAQRR